MARLRINDEHKAILIDLYERTEKTVDDLPYTEQFELLYTAFVARSGLILTRHDVWRALSSQRKARRLIRKER